MLQTKKYWIKNVNLITVSSIFIETNLHIHLRDNSDFNVSITVDE